MGYRHPFNHVDRENSRIYDFRLQIENLFTTYRTLYFTPSSAVPAVNEARLASALYQIRRSDDLLSLSDRENSKLDNK
jgi:hypothetical protein